MRVIDLEQDALRTKRRLRYFLTLCFVLACSGGVFVSVEYLKIRERFSFELMQRVARYDEDISTVEGFCRSKNQRTCFDAVMLKTAWRSVFDLGDFDKLSAACSSGDKRACRHLKSMIRAQKRDPAEWLGSSEKGNLVNQHSWPRVLFLKEQLTYQGWLDVAYNAVGNEQQRMVDVVCGKTREFSGALVCATYGSVEPNLALGRIASLVEQGGILPSLAEHRQSPLLRYWQGVDIKRSDFNNSVKRISDSGARHPEEDALWAVLAQREWDFLLTFNVFSVFSDIPAHEFLHGVYFSSEQYRNLVSDVISASPLQLLPLKRFVGSLYKTDNTSVLNNEIQAYALQPDSSFSREKHWIRAVRAVRDAVRKSPQYPELVREFSADD